MAGAEPDFLQAVIAGDIAAVKELLAADPTLVDAGSETGLPATLLALYNGQRDIVDLLLARGAQLDIFTAAALGRLDRVQTLARIDPRLVNAYGADGHTPLGLAAFFGRRAVAEYLLDRGADVDRQSKNSMMVAPLHAALAGGHNDVAQLLIEQGANVNTRAHAGLTPLHYAAENGMTEIVEMLLDRGAEINTRNAQGQTALGLARGKGRSDVVSILKAYDGRE